MSQQHEQERKLLCERLLMASFPRVYLGSMGQPSALDGLIGYPPSVLEPVPTGSGKPGPIDQRRQSHMRIKRRVEFEAFRFGREPIEPEQAPF